MIKEMMIQVGHYKSLRSLRDLLEEAGRLCERARGKTKEEGYNKTTQDLIDVLEVIESIGSERAIELDHLF